jgi:hypothetical protein
VSRLRAFLFAVRRADGSRVDVMFYAANVPAAKRYASDWAKRFPGVKVTLVPDQERVW